MSEGILVMESVPAGPDSGPDGRKRVVASFAERPLYVPGRRSWVKYRELGVTQASNGAMRAQVIEAGQGENKPTGWHLHHCDMQFLYVMSGAIHIAFSPDHVVRLGPGDTIMIPGETMHMELGEPEGLSVLEISLPADMGTEACVPPWGDLEVVFDRSASN